MLLNLSNHPSQKWSTEQTALAQQQYGGVVDMPFPNVPPEVDTEGVIALAQKYQQDILDLVLQYPNLTVHLMGELSFCFALVKMLQMQGISVVCSTTERTLIEEKDGLKTALFRFNHFRQYPKLSV